jgi:hypothetical protein
MGTLKLALVAFICTLLSLVACTTGPAGPPGIAGPQGPAGPSAPEGCVSPQAFGAKGDGLADDTAALQAALDTGRPVCVPAGTYVVSAPLTFITRSTAYTTGSISLRGAGPFATLFDNRVADGPMLKIDTDTTLKFQQGGSLRDFQIRTTTAPANSSGIFVRRAYQLLVENVRIAGLSGSGMIVRVSEGDPDGSVMVKLSRVWISRCARWGIDADVGSGLNELSYLKLEHVVIESCGAASTATPPPSGGMRWKGQILSLDSSGFVTNENVGLFVYGGAGAAQHLLAHGATWENNRRVGLRIETLTNGRLENCQFYNNDAHVATHGALLDPTQGAIQNVVFSGTVVRATRANSPYTAFTITGANAMYTVIEQTRWDNFDHPGQVRFADSGTRTRIDDQGYLYPHPSTVSEPVVLDGARTTYTPDVRQSRIHVVRLAAPGSYTINTPVPGGRANHGLELILDLKNTSGGAVSISFGGLLLARGFTNPPPGGRRVAPFYYNVEEGWVQTAHWTQ